MLYNVNVRTETRSGLYRGSVDSPTFVLDSDIQGIVSEGHASQIVNSWLSRAGLTILDVSVGVRDDVSELVAFTESAVSGDYLRGGVSDSEADTFTECEW